MSHYLDDHVLRLSACADFMRGAMERDYDPTTMRRYTDDGKERDRAILAKIDELAALLSAPDPRVA